MSIDNYTNVRSAYYNNYAPDQVSVGAGCIDISISDGVEKNPLGFTDLKIRLQGLFKGISHQLSYVFGKFADNVCGLFRREPQAEAGVLGKIKYTYQVAKNKLARTQKQNELNKTKALAKAYFKTAAMPNEGLKELMQVFAVRNGIDYTCRGTGKIFDGIDYTAGKGADAYNYLSSK